MNKAGWKRTVGQDDASKELLLKRDLLPADCLQVGLDIAKVEFFHVIYLIHIQQILARILDVDTSSVVENHTFPKVFGMQPAFQICEKCRRAQTAIHRKFPILPLKYLIVLEIPNN